MKVAVCIDSLARGGAQTALVHLVKELTPRGHTFLVLDLSGDTDSVHAATLSQAGAELVRIGRWALLGGVGLWRFIASIRRFGPQVLLTMLEYADQLGRVLGRCAGVPVISAERALYLRRRWFARFLDRFTMPLAASMTFNSRVSLREAEASGALRPGQGVYIPNGVSLALPSASREELRQRLGLSGRVIGMAARLVDDKRVDILLDAFAVLAPDVPDLTLAIAGGGPRRQALEARACTLGIERRSLFCGRLPRIADFLSCLDIYAHTSGLEGMPNAVMEAMTMGLPVLATDVAGTGELVEDGVTGLLIPPGDVPATVAALRRLLENPALASELAHNGQTRMRTAFSVEAMVDAYEALFIRTGHA